MLKLFKKREATLEKEDREKYLDYVSRLALPGIKEKEDKIWLDIKDKIVIRLYKSTFVNGNWEECKTKLLAAMEQ